ncbi:hypothetical protein [Photobacterium lucens]|uniref:hypothetical protein n=1 Tax=Photobacterium lucens TaxID=2562949 RepID=UPI00137093A5|nr:hypothetical protein [Photobacterium lucens]MBP2700236.1 hypothetical protein [Vibrio parahaemolyticus]MZG56753.1 hypothetical protein [Photobacterium lucens]MZG79358.1 hypothetical protein [Photobacterium lucens]
MSDSNITVKNSVSFDDYLRLRFSTGKGYSYYHGSDESAQRAIAVSCALELVRAQISSGSGYKLDGQLSQLSTFADQIQDALKVNNQ